MYDSVLIFISSLGTMLFACVCVCAKKRTHQLQPHVCMIMYVRLYMYGYVSLCMDGWVYACMRCGFALPSKIDPWLFLFLP